MEDQGGGDVYLSCHYEEEANRVVATIRDTGHGIPQDIVAKIFDPFFTTKSVGKGTGLGLSVSYGIIQEHGGTIEVESPAKGDKGELQGTAFHVMLPVALRESVSVKDQ